MDRMRKKTHIMETDHLDLQIYPVLIPLMIGIGIEIVDLLEIMDQRKIGIIEDVETQEDIIDLMIDLRIDPDLHIIIDIVLMDIQAMDQEILLNNNIINQILIQWIIETDHLKEEEELQLVPDRQDLPIKDPTQDQILPIVDINN